MITFAIILIAFGFLAMSVSGYFRQRCMTITCNCGREVMVDALIVDQVDVERFRQTLSEGCPICRTVAAMAPEVEEPDHVAAG